jgi:hypothetical protein
LFAEGVHEPNDIAGQLKDVVLLDGFRPVGLAVPTLVRRYRALARLGQRRQLVAPRVPRLWKAVAENDQRPGPLLGDIHLDAVGFDGLVLHTRHACSSVR